MNKENIEDGSAKRLLEQVLACCDKQRNSQLRTQLQDIEAALVELGIQRHDCMSLTSSAGKLLCAASDLTRVEDMVSGWTDSLQNSLTRTQLLRADLARSASLLKQTASDGTAQCSKANADRKFALTKLQRYKQSAELIEQRLSDIRIPSSVEKYPLSHYALVHRRAELSSVLQRNSQLNEVLERYGDLPPDVENARLKVRDMRLKLETLDDQLNRAVERV